LAATRLGHLEKQAMQSGTAQQVVALLQAAGALTPEAAAQALTHKQLTDGNLLQTLTASGALSFDALQEVLLRYGQLADAEVLTAPAALVAPDMTAVGGEQTIDEYRIDDGQLHTFLLTSGRLTQEQLDTALQAQQHTGHPLWRTVINIGLLTPQEMTEVIKTQGPLVHGQPTNGTMAESPEPGRTVVPQASRDAAQRVIEVDDTATAVQIVNAIFAGAIQARATDIHIEPQVPRMRVRYRIDGMLFDVLTVPQPLETSLISRIKVLADMNITERRLPQDGRLSFRLDNQEYNMRVATIPTVYGEKLVLRLLIKSNVLTGLKQLGLEPDDEQRLRSLIAKPQGMILVTGPIGSGKTTTLYAALNEVNILTNNIVTIEDPVEYQLTGINQVEVDTKIGLTFASGLRSILRQDADILMVGEIRDVETATVAVRAALTGQQLFSTLHTVDTPSAITTLEHFGIQPYLIASALSGVVAQRLVRRICQACRQWYTPSPAVLRYLGLKPGQREWRFAYGTGCEACYYTGYLGRTGLFEILRVSETVRQMIMARESEQALKTAAVREGMHTLQQSGITKIIQGVTTPQEVMREVYL
jgi:type II secretory ATPase GspE/PulE/Tfp pilus assembly ATPase PilB-like protein